MRQQLWKSDLDFLFLPIFLALVFKKMPGQGEQGGRGEDRKSGGEEGGVVVVEGSWEVVEG